MADAQNCRVLVINANRTVAHQIGTDGVCVHHPPASMGSPNGDTPLADGNLLVSEINGSWVSEYTLAGRLAWTVQLPISYPSDPQQLGPDRYLIDAPMFVKGFFFFILEIGKILVLLSADTTGMGRSRWRAGSYQVTRSAGRGGPGAAGRSLEGQHGGAAAE